MLRSSPLHDLVAVSSRALSSHCAGCPPSEEAVTVARELGLPLDAHTASTPLHPDDTATADLVLCLDRFDQEALLREGPHSVGDDCRVRRLTSFCAEPRLRGDVPDPAYGMPPASHGASAAVQQQQQQLQRTWAAVRSIRAGCRGVVAHLQELAIHMGILCTLKGEHGGVVYDSDHGVTLVRSPLRDGNGQHGPSDPFPCPVQPEQGASMALASALDASMECPVDWGHASMGHPHVVGAATERDRHFGLLVHGATNPLPATLPPPAPLPLHRRIWMQGGQLFTLRYVVRPTTKRALTTARSAQLGSNGEHGSGSNADEASPLRVATTVRFTPTEQFRPHSYWSDVANVCAELRTWQEANGEEAGGGDDTMPSLAQLRASGAHSLEAAITRHGGPRAVAAACGLQPRTVEYTSLTWEAIAAEVAAVAASAGTPAGLMPPRSHFAAAGRLGLYRNLAGRPGGVAAAARRLGMEWRKGPGGQRYRFAKLMTVADARAAVTAVAAASGCASDELPCRKEFVDLGRLPLYNRLVRLSGGTGMPGLARLLGLRFQGRVYQSYRDDRQLDGGETLSLEELRAELLLHADAKRPAAMPSIRKLQLAGRHDICAAIVAHGGAAAVAAALGLAKEPRGRKALPGGASKMTAVVAPPPRLSSTRVGGRGSVDSFIELEE
jgi:protein-tyrosine-phosphatase